MSNGGMRGGNEEESEDATCDFSMLLSQDLISEVMEAYLNKTMLKRQVEVVHLRNTEAGYVFSLKYKPKVQVVMQHTKPGALHRLEEEVTYEVYASAPGAVHPVKVGRSRNGRFTTTSTSAATPKVEVS